MQKIQSLNSNKKSQENSCRTFQNNPPLLGHLYKYLKNPVYPAQRIYKNFFLKFWDIVRLGALSVVIAFILAAVIVYVLSLTDYNQNSHALMEFILDQENIWLLMILAVFFAPFKEELTFRMILKYSPFKFSFSIAFLITLLLEVLLNFVNKSLIFDFKLWQGALVYFGLIIVIGFGFGFLFKKFLNKEKIDNFYKNNFFKIFYFQALAFGLVHIINYHGISSLWYIAPILVMPQIFLGLILGFIRMKFGLKWSIFFHAMYNGSGLLPFLILSNVSDGLYNQLLGKDPSQIDINNLSRSDLEILALAGILFLFLVFLIIIALIHLIIDELTNKKKKAGIWN